MRCGFFPGAARRLAEVVLRGRRGFFPGAAQQLAEAVVERPVVGAVEALPCGDVAWHAVCPYGRDTAADSILIISTGGGLTWGTGPCGGRRSGKVKNAFRETRF